MDWLKSEGATLMSVSGYPVPDMETASCPGLCEGSCPLLKLDSSLFNKGDYNMRRKITKIKFEKDKVMIQDKLVGVPQPKMLPGIGLCYGGVQYTVERPKIICVEEKGKKFLKKDRIKLCKSSPQVVIERSPSGAKGKKKMQNRGKVNPTNIGE